MHEHCKRSLFSFCFAWLHILLHWYFVAICLRMTGNGQVAYPGLKIMSGHRPKSDHIARRAVHFSPNWSVRPDKICAYAFNNHV